MFVAQCVLLTLVAIVKTDEIQGTQVSKTCSRFDYEYKLLERIRMLESAQREMTVKMEQVQERIDDILHSPSLNDTHPTVAFYAGLSRDISGVALGYKVVMDKVFLNQGKAYNAYNGIFRAPFKGVYEFTLHDCSYPSLVAHLFMMKEGESVGYTYTHGPFWTCSGRSVVVLMQEGETIWVEMAGSTAGVYQQSEKHKEYRTTFSGHYIGMI